MNFIVDAMLGKLARWLRIMGHNVKYAAKTNDAELIDISEKEKRILLTRDFALYKHGLAKNVETFYVEGNNEVERLSGLAKRFNIALNVNLKKSRCPLCNAKLKSVPKTTIENELRKNTLLHYDTFWKCPTCHQIYWQGSHWAKIFLALQDAQEKLKWK